MTLCDGEVVEMSKDPGSGAVTTEMSAIVRAWTSVADGPDEGSARRQGHGADLGQSGPVSLLEVDRALINSARFAIKALVRSVGPLPGYDLVDRIDQESAEPRSLVQLAFHEMLDEGILEEDELSTVRLVNADWTAEDRP